MTKRIKLSMPKTNVIQETFDSETGAAGTEYFIVEQDNATELENPFDEVKISAEYLKNYK